MESIHSRIRRLRVAKELTLEGFAKLVGVQWQSAQQWERERDGTAPTRTRQARVAEVLGVSVHELVAGPAPATRAASDDPGVARTAKEEMLLELYRKLIPRQQEELFKRLWSDVETNIAIGRHLNNKDLRGVDDRRVEDKYGTPRKPKKPAPKKPPIKSKAKAGKPEPRRPDRAQDDNP